MRRTRVALCLLPLLTLALSVRGTDGHQTPLCEILTSAEQYAGKSVTIRGTYRSAFEASELYCLSCDEGGRVWVEFDSANGSDKAAKALTRVLHHRDGTVNGVFTGVFHANGAYGHLGAFRHELLVTSVSDLKVVDRLGLSRFSLSAETRKKVCQ